MQNEVVMREANNHFPYLKSSELEVHSTHWLAAAQISSAKTPSVKRRAGII
jgi:hypothetical protein